ncbi:unnamed protein product, partial [Amoebophrya sp. A25]
TNHSTSTTRQLRAWKWYPGWETSPDRILSLAMEREIERFADLRADPKNPLRLQPLACEWKSKLLLDHFSDQDHDDLCLSTMHDPEQSSSLSRLRTALSETFGPDFIYDPWATRTVPGETTTSSDNNKNSRSRPFLLFHGTSTVCAKSILREGRFRARISTDKLKAVAVQSGRPELSAHTTKAYGDGIYAAFHPDTALLYATGRACLEDDCGALVVAVLEESGVVSSVSGQEESRVSVSGQVLDSCLEKRISTSDLLTITSDPRDARPALEEGKCVVVTPPPPLSQSVGTFVVLPESTCTSGQGQGSSSSSGQGSSSTCPFTLRPICVFSLGKADSNTTRRGLVRRYRALVLEKFSKDMGLPLCSPEEGDSSCAVSLSPTAATRNLSANENEKPSTTTSSSVHTTSPLSSTTCSRTTSASDRDSPSAPSRSTLVEKTKASSDNNILNLFTTLADAQAHVLNMLPAVLDFLEACYTHFDGTTDSRLTG